MRSMEDPHLAEQNYGNAASFAFADLTSKTYEECLNVFPGDVRTGGV